MIHQFRDKKQIERRKKIIRNISGLGLFFVLSVLGFLSWTGQIFNFIGRPIWKSENFVNTGLYNINYLVRTKASISNENHNLIKEISSLRASMVDYQILKNETDQLKELLGRIPNKNNFVLGNSRYFIVEACEYKESFLNLTPNILIILNIFTRNFDIVSVS